MLCKNLPLAVVSDYLDVGKTPKVQPAQMGTTISMSQAYEGRRAYGVWRMSTVLTALPEIVPCCLAMSTDCKELSSRKQVNLARLASSVLTTSWRRG